MRKIGKWALTLGLLAAYPGLTLAAGPETPASQTSEKAVKSDKTGNQKTAENIAKALRAAKISGQDIAIEFKGGVATLSGMVNDPEMRQRAEMATSRVPGVQSVENKLQAPRPQAPVGREAAAGGVMAANHTAGPERERVRPINFEAGAPMAAPGGGNQETAEQIAAALSAAQLSGYDIEIRFQNGVCVLDGAVGTNAQRAAAEQVCSQVPGVGGVQNRLRTTEEPLAAARPQMPQQMQQPNVYGAAYQAGPTPIAPGQGPMGPGPGAMGAGGPPMAMAGYGHHPGMGGAPMYNGPALPDYAWPSYAQYPNSAAVTYPQQYSASAFPYIGPFYPYPQVPLGWRDATLRWDDGQWNLQFRQRTDRWWWFLSPKNWD